MSSSQLDSILRAQIGRTLDDTDLGTLGDKYEGKVRDNYTAGDERIIVVTDRLSTFDVVVGSSREDDGRGAIYVFEGSVLGGLR